MDNPQDIKDLFDILPNGVKKIYKDTPTNEIEFYDKDGVYIDSCAHIRVNWHEDDMYVVQAVNEVGVGIGPLRTILKSRVRNNKIYWPDEKIPEAEQTEEIIEINGIKYKKIG